jgi:hypothetical protein
MKFIILSVGVFLSCAASMSQEVKHAPTFQSCAADLNLWTSQIPGWPNPSVEQSRGGTKNLTVQEMRGRVLAVSECSMRGSPFFGPKFRLLKVDHRLNKF